MHCSAQPRLQILLQPANLFWRLLSKHAEIYIATPGRSPGHITRLHVYLKVHPLSIHSLRLVVRKKKKNETLHTLAIEKLHQH